MSKAAELAAFIANQSSANVASKNIIINGDMSIAQRGTSSTSSGIYSVDRFGCGFGQVSVTQSQQALTSGGPYEAGFNNFFRMANTSTSSNAGSYVQGYTNIEAQDIANSGWNFKSSNSFITLSFWARSSLAGTYYIRINTSDGTAYYRIKAFTLSADTWTKVTFTIEGNSNLTFNDDNGTGLSVVIVPHYGTNLTGSNASTTTWFTLNTDYFPDFAQNWGNTASATFDVTGLQLEVGEVATPFKHESYGDNLARCQRYFVMDAAGTAYKRYLQGVCTTTTWTECLYYYPVTMRAQPSLGSSGTNGDYLIEVNSGASAAPSEAPSRSSHSDTTNCIVNLRVSGTTLTTGVNCQITSYNSTNGYLSYNAEL